MPTVGFIGPTTEATGRSNFNVFEKRLKELGWSPGQNIVIELRWAQGEVANAERIAADFARAKADIIVTGGDEFVLAARRAAPETAIVTIASGDPVGTGQVASLARPGGQITGQSVVTTETASKRLELLRELVPNLRHIGVLADFTNPLAAAELQALQTVGQRDGLEISRLDIRSANDIGPAMEQHRAHIQALYVVSQPLTTANAATLNALALAAGLPTAHVFRSNAAKDGLFSYGPDLTDLYRHAAEFVNKILRGTRPEEIPVEQPTKFTLAINLKTARALGITVPPLMLARADEVIE